MCLVLLQWRRLTCTLRRHLSSTTRFDEINNSPASAMAEVIAITTLSLASSLSARRNFN